MLEDLLISKIELVQEQIESLEKSGFYTEKEMDQRSYPLRRELELLQSQISITETSKTAANYGISIEKMNEGRKRFNECFAKLKEARKDFFNVKTSNAETLTPNHQEA